MKSVRLIVDGSALGNPGVGGWACIMQYQACERILTGSERDSTNNKMEMVAALRGPQRAMPRRDFDRFGVLAARNDPIP